MHSFDILAVTMYLKELTIDGFKSFAHKSKLGFTTPISAIVGPNGSGKSNVAEAFRFVLGEQSLKNMRGKKGEDLIFMGSAGRSQRGAVKFVFDNRKKILDIEYDEVIIERIVSRDGSNEYFINGSKVRAKDIAELLSGANIGASGHHIISQGEADKILSINNKERKTVIEEALGLRVFTIKKQEAERKLSKTMDNLKEVQTEQKTLAPRISYLKREVEKVEKARSMKEELRELYKAYFPTRIPLEKERKDLDTKIDSKQEVINALEKKIEKLQQEFNQAKDESHIAKKAQELVEVEKQLQSDKSQKAEIERMLGKLDAQIEYALEEKKRYEEYSQEQASHNALMSVSTKLHEMWKMWAGHLVKSKKLTAEAEAEISAQLTEYDETPENAKQMYESQAREIISIVEEREHVVLPVFDDSKLETFHKQKEEYTRKLTELDALLQSREEKRDTLDDARDASETVGQRVQIQILTVEKEKSNYIGELNSLQFAQDKIENKLEEYKREEASLRTLFGAEADAILSGTVQGESDELNARDKIMRLKVLLENGSTSMSEDVVSEYKKLTEHKEFVDGQVDDLKKTESSLQELIQELSDEIEIKFREGLEKINKAFSKFFETLFSGGRAEIFVADVPIRKENEDDIQEYEVGVDLSVSLPNKKIRGMSMLSGGERSLTSIALLFAMSSVTPPPFIILDETDAALDEANSKRYGDMIELLAKESQLILITHNRETMSRAGILYGVTMGNDGASRLLSISLEQAEAVAK